MKRWFMKFFYDVDLPSNKLEKAKARLSKAEKEKLELDEQLERSRQLEEERRIAKLECSSEFLKRFEILTKFYNNIELNQAVISLQFLHGIFVEHKEYDIDLLMQVHQYYSESALELLEKNKSNFDKNIQMLNTQKKQFVTELDMFKSSLVQHDKTIFNVNKSQYNIEYTETLTRMFKLLIYSIVNDIKDPRLGDNFKYKSFTSFTRILIYNVKNVDLAYEVSDVIVQRRELIEHKGFYITNDAITLLKDSHYVLNYLGTFIINELEIEIIKIGNSVEPENVIFFEVKSMKIYTVQNASLINEIINEKNTENYVIRQKIDEITRKISRIDIDLSTRLSLKPDIIDVINRFNERLQTIEIINKNEDIDLEIDQLNALLNVDIQS